MSAARAAKVQLSNTTMLPIGFGQSTDQEMRHNVVDAWPVHALDDPGGAPLKASNTCLH